MKLKDKQQERHAKAKQAREILDTAQKEERELTGEEVSQFDSLDEELTKLDSDIRRLERGEELRTDDKDDRWHPETDEEREAELERDRERRDAPNGPETREREERATPKTLKEFNEQRRGVLPQDADEYRMAFFAMVTSRSKYEQHMEPDELRALSKATAAAGANLVPTSFERTLIEKAREFGVMRELADVVQTETGEKIQVPKESSHGAAAWTAENAAYTESDEAFGQAELSAYKAATIMKVSEELLTDSAFDLEEYIGRQYGARIGVLENTAYVAGDGSGKPTGFLVDAPVGVTAPTGNTTSLPPDTAIDLFHSVLSVFRARASWLSNDAGIKAIRKLKDGDNQYLWQPGLQAGTPDVLLGRPIFTDPDMPVPAANAKSLAFGDFKAYRIRDVQGVALQRLDELYAANGQVGFRAYHRTEGKLLNTDAVKVAANSAT